MMMPLVMGSMGRLRILRRVTIDTRAHRWFKWTAGRRRGRSGERPTTVVGGAAMSALRSGSRVAIPLAATVLAFGLTSESADAAPNPEYPPFSVSSTGPDTHTTIYVTQGQTLTTYLDGTWNTNVLDPNSGPVGAEGNSPNAQGDVNCRRVPGPTGAMILAIEGAYGSLAFTTPPTTGYVDMFINDRTDNFIENGKSRNCMSDNGGAITGRIVVS
jgi:hypothetical protein